MPFNPLYRLCSARSSLHTKGLAGRSTKIPTSTQVVGSIWEQQPEQVDRVFQALQKGLKYAIIILLVYIAILFKNIINNPMKMHSMGMHSDNYHGLYLKVYSVKLIAVRNYISFLLIGSILKAIRQSWNSSHPSRAAV